MSEANIKIFDNIEQAIEEVREATAPLKEQKQALMAEIQGILVSTGISTEDGNLIFTPESWAMLSQLRKLSRDESKFEMAVRVVELYIKVIREKFKANRELNEKMKEEAQVTPTVSLDGVEF